MKTKAELVAERDAAIAQTTSPQTLPARVWLLELTIERLSKEIAELEVGE